MSRYRASENELCTDRRESVIGSRDTPIPGETRACLPSIHKNTSNFKFRNPSWLEGKAKHGWERDRSQEYAVDLFARMLELGAELGRRIVVPRYLS